MNVTTPEWVKDAIFYQIFPDRFARSARASTVLHLEPWDAPPTFHGFKGGDLFGIVERLDYLQDLGVTAIYLNPVFQSTANHRYHTFDYFRVDPLLGGDEGLNALLEAAHARDMRVILDGVFNHASRGFFQFNHLLENGPASPYREWFVVHDFPLHAYDEHRPPNYEAWWNLHALPKFNHHNPQVREFLWHVGEYWTRQGIDGWRLDVPGEITVPGFWEEFRRRVKSINPDAYLVGEIWHHADEWLRGDRFDAVMNYPLTRACLGFFVGERMDTHLVEGVGYAPVPLLDAPGFAHEVDHLLARYPPDIILVQFNLLDSHDTARFLTIARGDTTALKLAWLFLVICPGTPCIYYGDEIGLEGGRDPDCRRAFPWGRPESWNQDIREWFQRAIALRKHYPALRRGAYRTLYAHGNVYVCARYDEHNVVIAAFNVGTSTARVTLDIGELPLAPATALQDLWEDRVMPLAGTGPLHLEVPPRGVRLLGGEMRLRAREGR
ncbi:MAG: alpha-amylase family glycosyl hydrolase [Ardenticatenia bacterium]|nr:alpha-amylase family glycosyl hydrolase [Ardenticatenia bacterium]